MPSTVSKQIRPEPGDPVNICGVLVQARPEGLDSVSNALRRLPGLEIHERADDGHLVVTIEDTDTIFASETLQQVYAVAGVLNASLVYHHCETIEDSHSEAYSS